MTIVREERIGNQRLILGDCRQIMPLLGRCDAVVTDPPYGIGYSPGSGGGGIRDRNGRRYEKRFTGENLIIGDDEPFDPTQIVDLGLPTILWGGNHYASRLPDSKAWLVWDKRRGTTTNDFADCEIAWSNLTTPARCLPHLWNGMLRDSERSVPRVHATQKPIAVMEWCLGFLPDAHTILDPFMGSGTTLVACQRMGRHGTGIEIDPEYFEIACRRLDEAARQPDLLIPVTQTPTQEVMDL